MLTVLKKVDFSSSGKRQALKDNPWRAGQTKFQISDRKPRISFHYTADDGQILPFTPYYSEVLLTETQDDPFNKKQQRKTGSKGFFPCVRIKRFLKLGTKQRLMRKPLHSLDLLKQIFKRGINKFSFHKTPSAETRARFTFSKVSSDRERGWGGKPQPKIPRSNTPARPESLALGKKVFYKKNFQETTYHLLVNSFLENNRKTIFLDSATQ